MSEAATAAGFNRLLSDERLTRRAVGGDERAFAAIFRRYHQSLYRFCLAIVGNPEDAQDALQNTMIKVLRALPGEERKIDLKPWLYRIAHNESIDLLRRRRETRELKVEQVAPGYGLAEDAETRERLRRLLVDLRELPERQREVLVMRELAGLDFEEIATALTTTGAVARQTLYEARQSLLQMEEGREMSCETVTRALSDGDGRVTRRRDVRAHLRSCAECRRFRDEIKSRERTFAAISPLPAVAAAGMLQGLAGGSQAASGGGLAAALGGGAAKTIGASAAAKGVATVAVVAAVGVGAADRTGVIHLGLPGEGGGAAKSSEAAPGGGPEGQREASQGVAGEGAAKEGGNHDGHPGGSAGLRGTDPSQEPAPAAGTEGAPVSVTTPAVGGHPGSPQADSKAQGPPLEHVTAPGHEEQPPAAAGHGQEPAAEKEEAADEKEAAGDKAAADGKAPPPSEEGNGGGGGPPVDVPKAAPVSPPSSPPVQAPGGSPAKPSPKAQPQPSPQPQPPASDKAAPGPPAGSPAPGPPASPAPPAGSPGPPAGSPGPPSGSPGPPSGSPGPPSGSPGPPAGKGKGKGAAEGAP